MSIFTLNAIHFHLLLNHFPIVLSVISPVILAYGVYRKNTESVNIALSLFVAAAIFAIAVFVSGREAIGAVSWIPGIDIHALVMHESVAATTFLLMEILWTVSAIALYAGRKKPVKVGYHIAIFLLSLVVIGAVSLTGYYGGSIRHVEIHENP